jgi:hypothetical protein
VAAWDSSSRSLALSSSGVMAAKEGREMGGGREADGS